MSAFDRWCAYAEEIGIPEDDIEDVVFSAEVCERCDEGTCAENTKLIIDNWLEKHITVSVKP